MNKKVLLGILATFVAVAVIIGGFFYKQQIALADGKIIDGVKVADVEIGGLTAGQALEKLKTAQHKLLSDAVKVRYGQRYWTFPYAAITTTDLPEQVKKAVSLGRDKGIIENYQEQKAAKKGKYNFKISLIPDVKKINHNLKKVKKVLDKPPVEAKFVVSDINQVNITPPQEGLGLDTATTATAILKAVKPSETPTVDAVVYPVRPRFTTEDIKKWRWDGYITSFTTSFNPLNRERTENVRIAAQALDKIVILPGDEFSFNEVVGPRSEEAGYKESLVIQNNVFTPGLGGGVCQVSSTLYNNVLKSNLKVIQRRRHSLPVGYVSPGLDSTVAYGAIDLKFVNTYDFPIIIRTKLNSNNLSIAFLGDKSKVPQVIITTNIEKVLLPTGSRTIYDPNLPKGKRVVDQAKKGYKVTVYKKIISTTGAKTTVVSKDTYPPTPQIIRIGTNTKTVWGETYGQTR